MMTVSEWVSLNQNNALRKRLVKQIARDAFKSYTNELFICDC